MPVMIEKTAKTVQQAIDEALEELKMTEDEVVIEVLDEGDSGLLGLGRKPARVRVSYEAESADEALPDADDIYYGDDESYQAEPETPEEADTVSYVAAVLSGIGIHGKISSYREGDTLHIDVTGRDCGAAIGYHGETLEAIQYLTSLAANRNSDTHLRVVVDIAGYRKKREDTLVSLAERTAEKVADSGQAINLEPMNPAERRIIHSALQSFPKITTFSEGEDPKRYIVIAPEDENAD